LTHLFSKDYAGNNYMLICKRVVRLSLKAKFYYAILVADKFEAGRRPAASLNLAYHLAR